MSKTETAAGLVLIAVFTAAIAVGSMFDGKSTETKRGDNVNVTNAAHLLDEGEPRHVDIAICLDTSGSMSQLIQSARQKLWAVVNELATADPKPVLRVALYQYGGSALASEDGWVKQLCPLTNDLDMVYEKLFELNSSGSTEYVARVMHAATTQLKWSQSKSALKIIFIAGNERATQDPSFQLRSTCKAAATAGILVNTVYCGDEVTGRNTGWSDAAMWADGRYAAIDQKSGTIAIQTVYDKKLAELSSKLNKTYVRFGVSGAKRADRQEAQDANASSLNTAAAADRATVKATGFYDNSTWDLGDASRKKGFDIRKVDNKYLPKVMQSMTDGDKVAYVATQVKARAALQKEIRDLSKLRAKDVKAKAAAGAIPGKISLDKALKDMVRTQAEKQNFKFKE
ncbi:MAG: VWA domain-containing protein [Phycisphaerales bacterium]|jgi:hypothetical protein|nr:VWA domain-containing protein [Phycisphaerales bacterium]